MRGSGLQIWELELRYEGPAGAQRPQAEGSGGSMEGAPPQEACV